MHKILIANRGEIAMRVIRTARRLGFRTVAVYSEADADAPHVHAADQAVCIGAPAVSASYLSIEKILDAARRSGADAVHPGYGFLSENAAFARACEAAGLIFIGPPAAAIELMGSKRLSKLAMLEAGVPCIAGYQSADQSDASILAAARSIGFPLMLKASAGGGGRGMRLVQDEASLPIQLKMARSEALNAFGSDELILEQALLEPRHIEVQVFADAHGNAIYLGERDCSIQRRHQKVVEESPSPFVDDTLRRAMGEAAVRAALSCQYRGAGTVEFLVDCERRFYFLEMNTRLQVEHPVTEMVCGLDLVEWQLRIACGEELPLTQAQVRLQGHAIEVRLYAEDPRANFLPQTGTVHFWQAPSQPDVRVDSGIQCGQLVTPFYDPMLAKVIAWGEKRALAARRLASALDDLQLLGVNNNRYFLARVLRHPAFLDGMATTAFIEQHFQNDDSLTRRQPLPLTLARAGIIFYHTANLSGQTQRWRSTARHAYLLRLACGDQHYRLRLVEQDGCYQITVNEQTFSLQLLRLGADECVLSKEGLREAFRYVRDGDALWMDDGSGHFQLINATHHPAEAAGAEGMAQVHAPMDGAIVDVLVKEGDRVKKGQTLIILDAMKMEHPLVAGRAGIVRGLTASRGAQVKSRQLLAMVETVDGGGE